MRFVYWTLIICIGLWGAAFFYLTELSQNKSDQKKTTGDPYLESSKIGHKAPAFELLGLDDHIYSLENLHGKSVVLNFWASWCDPCKQEAPHLVELYEKYKENTEIYAINLTKNDRLKDVSKFAETFNFKFPVLLDSTGRIAEKFKVIAIPTTYFINENGIIVDQIIGIANKKTLEEKFEMIATKGH